MYMVVYVHVHGYVVYVHLYVQYMQGIMSSLLLWLHLWYPAIIMK